MPRTKRMKSRFCKKLLMACVLPCLMLYFILSLGFYAYAGAYTNSKTGYRAILSDDAGILSDADGDLEALKEFTRYGNAVIFTTDEGRSDMDAVAREAYTRLLGKETQSGAIFVISMNNRQLKLYVEGAVDEGIASSKLNTIVDNVYRYASDGDYDRCAVKVFTQMETLLEGGRIAQPMRWIVCLLLSVIAAVVITYLRAMSARSADAPKYVNQEASARLTFQSGLAGLAVGLAGLTFLSRQQHRRVNASPGPRGGGFPGGGGGFSGGGFSGGGFSGGGRSGHSGGHGF